MKHAEGETSVGVGWKRVLTCFSLAVSSDVLKDGSWLYAIICTEPKYKRQANTGLGFQHVTAWPGPRTHRGVCLNRIRQALNGVRMPGSQRALKFSP